MTSVSVNDDYKVVIIEEETNVTTVVSAPSPSLVITAVEVGPQGPQGPPGEAYVFQQLSASATWTINHNLGFKPSVELLNSGSQEIEGDVVHTSVNQTVISFTSPVLGSARLN